MADGWLGFASELDRTSSPDLAVVVLGRPVDADRVALLGRVRSAATAAPDRLAEIDRTRREVAELMLVRLNRAGLVVTWAGLPWAGASALRTEDRVWLSMAAQDAAVADLLAARLSPDDRDQLRAGWDVVASMPGLGFTGAPSFRGSLGIAAALAVVVAASFIGALPLVLILALRSRRRPTQDAD